MFATSRSKSHRESASFRAGKSISKKQKSFKDYSSSKRLSMHQVLQHPPSSSQSSPITLRANSSPTSPTLASAIVTISIGPEQRLFAAHEDVLCKCPFFADACRAQFFEPAGTKRIDLPHDIPEVFSAILEFLYKGDYSPKLQYSKKQGRWYLEDADLSAAGGPEATICMPNGVAVLKDTVIYCTAHRFALVELQRLALKKQGLQAGVQCSTILASARFAYAHTPASDAKLRAHYLALIIRSRNTFKRSGTMQMEMEAGGSPLFFDLFVAMVNHLDDVAGSRSIRV